MRYFFVLLAFFLLSSNVYAETIELPEEELSTESVLPVFNKTVAVRNRLVQTEKRIEVGGGFGLNLIEALYNNLVFHGTASYHFTEEHALTFFGMFGSDKLSNNGKDLKAGKGINTTFDASLAPTPEYYITANYQFTAYYGKMSIAKKSAMNLSLFGLAGGGVMSWGDKVSPVLNIGVGQKFYFTPRLALRTDLQLMTFLGPNPTSKPLETGSGSKKSDYFSETTYFRTFLNFGLVFLL